MPEILKGSRVKVVVGDEHLGKFGVVEHIRDEAVYVRLAAADGGYIIRCRLPHVVRAEDWYKE